MRLPRHRWNAPAAKSQVRRGALSCWLMTTYSRRELIATGGVLTAGVALGQQKTPSLNAGEVIRRIKEHVGVPWFPKTVDNLLTGSPELAVKGIATTMMATLDVIERCVAQNKNMIVTHETPFYLHQDGTDDIREDKTLLYKMEYCKKHDV